MTFYLVWFRLVDRYVCINGKRSPATNDKGKLAVLHEFCLRMEGGDDGRTLHSEKEDQCHEDPPDDARTLDEEYKLEN